MTHHTEAERAIELAEKHGATSYRNRADTKNPAFGFTPSQLSALIADVEQAARRAPAVPVPQGLREAAQAVVERWDTPLWKDVPATTVYIADLRAALAAAPQPPDDLKRGNPATKPDEGPSSCAHCGNPWGEAAPIDPQLLQAIQCAGFQVIKGALGYELMKLGQAYAQADHIPDAGKMVAAPVQMPEPLAVAFRFETEENGPTETSFYPSDRIGMGWTALYTEQQVRQLLAAHGIQEQST